MALFSSLPRFSIPVTDQGKWATGMMKKLTKSISIRLKVGTRECINLPVRIVENTGQGIIPSHECREKPEKPSSLDDRWVRRASRAAVQIPDSEQ